MITFCNSDAEEAWLTIDLTLKNRKYGSSITRINNKAERPKSVTVRCIKRTLDNGELLLITNAEDLSTKEVCDIFYTRRNEETSFDTDKNKLEVENFSSKTPNGVQHDFYSTILTANIAQLIISAAQIKVDEEQAKKDNKYQYKVNTAVAIGLVKDEIPLLLTGKQKAESWFEDLVKLAAKHTEPIRKNRMYKKKRKHKLKYPINKRRVL